MQGIVVGERGNRGVGMTERVVNGTWLMLALELVEPESPYECVLRHDIAMYSRLLVVASRFPLWLDVVEIGLKLQLLNSDFASVIINGDAANLSHYRRARPSDRLAIDDVLERDVGNAAVRDVDTVGVTVLDTRPNG